MLALSTVVAIGGHTFPFGTVAFGCLFLAALWLDRFGYEGSAIERARAETSPA